MIGAISPAVLVPSMMNLQEQGYGVEKNIPTTLIASASFDNIIAITLFIILSGVEFQKVGNKSVSPVQTLYTTLYVIATGVFMGFLVGGVLGYVLKK